MDRKAVVTFAIVAAVAFVLVTLAMAAVLWAGWWLYQQGEQQHHQMQQRLHEQESRERELIRGVQLQFIAGHLDEAAAAATAGDIEQVLAQLRAVEEQFMVIAAAATQSGDTAAGAQFEALRQQAESAISRIVGAPEGERQAEAARAAVGDLREALEEHRPTAPPRE